MLDGEEGVVLVEGDVREQDRAPGHFAARPADEPRARHGGAGAQVVDPELRAARGRAVGNDEPRPLRRE